MAAHVEGFLRHDVGTAGIADKHDPAIADAEVCDIRFVSRAIINEPTAEQLFDG